MTTRSVSRLVRVLPKYRVAFAVSYGSALVAMLLTFVYVSGAGVTEQNPITRAVFEAFPEGGLAFVVVLFGKAIVLVGTYRLVLPWTARMVQDAFGTPSESVLIAAWGGAFVCVLDACANLLASLLFPHPTLTEGVTVFMAAFLVAMVAGLLAMPDDELLQHEGSVESTDIRLPLFDDVGVAD